MGHILNCGKTATNTCIIIILEWTTSLYNSPRTFFVCPRNVDLRNYVPLFGVTQSNVDLRNYVISRQIVIARPVT